MNPPPTLIFGQGTPVSEAFFVRVVISTIVTIDKKFTWVTGIVGVKDLILLDIQEEYLNLVQYYNSNRRS